MDKDPLKIALHFLKFRPRSVFEIRKKLEAKRIDEKEIEKVISVLKREKLLDDRKFAKMWIESRNNLRPSGSYVLKMELRRLGIAEDIIEEVLTPQRDEVLARKALESKSRLKNADFNKKAAFLQRRGFATNIIYQIIKK